MSATTAATAAVAAVTATVITPPVAAVVAATVTVTAPPVAATPASTDETIVDLHHYRNGEYMMDPGREECGMAQPAALYAKDGTALVLFKMDNGEFAATIFLQFSPEVCWTLRTIDCKETPMAVLIKSVFPRTGYSHIIKATTARLIVECTVSELKSTYEFIFTRGIAAQGLEASTVFNLRTQDHGNGLVGGSKRIPAPLKSKEGVAHNNEKEGEDTATLNLAKYIRPHVELAERPMAVEARNEGVCFLIIPLKDATGPKTEVTAFLKYSPQTCWRAATTEDMRAALSKALARKDGHSATVQGYETRLIVTVAGGAQKFEPLNFDVALPSIGLSAASVWTRLSQIAVTPYTTEAAPRPAHAHAHSVFPGDLLRALFMASAPGPEN